MTLEAVALGIILAPDSTRTTETVAVVRGVQMLLAPVPNTQTPVPETLDSGAMMGLVSLRADGLAHMPPAMVEACLTVEEEVVVVVMVVGTIDSRAAPTPVWGLLIPSLQGTWRKFFESKVITKSIVIFVQGLVIFLGITLCPHADTCTCIKYALYSTSYLKNNVLVSNWTTLIL